MNIAAYNLDRLADDVIGLIDAAGQQKALLVGHDWGAAVAWWVANKFPERLERLLILNVPHHAVMQRALQGNFSQMRKSWYILFFQLPWLPEAIISKKNWLVGRKVLQISSHPGTPRHL